MDAARFGLGSRARPYRLKIFPSGHHRGAKENILRPDRKPVEDGYSVSQWLAITAKSAGGAGIFQPFEARADGAGQKEIRDKRAGKPGVAKPILHPGKAVRI